MSTYKVNLPETSFPMRADLAKREPNLLKFWQDIDLYNNFFNIKNSDKKFALHDGPPYANGDIHIGHALNKILKDITMKAQLLNGYAVPYVPGWDCHGLPIELNVEKKFGKAGDKITVEQFMQECRKYAATQVDAQREEFKRLGVIGDWEHPYETMDFKYEANIVRALAKIIANGYVERGYKPVHWCVACGSALAEAEVEYQDKTSPAIDVKFKAVNADFSVPIWTTTPWTLPANEAVCLHPELEYVLVDCGEKLLIAKDLLAATMKRYGIETYKIGASYFGKDLEGQLLQHPFIPEKNVPIILGEHVAADAGTGAVHTAPAHGQDDFMVGKKYNLPVKNPVGSNGKFLPDTLFFAGENVFVANDKVIEKLRENGALLHFENITHSYPHCWRHKKPLIFRATQQWFVAMDNEKQLRQKALAAIKKVKWIPESGEDRITDMVAKRPDWCISRQRTWGTPMTLFVHKITGELHPKTQELMETIAQNIEKEGIIYWRNLDAEKFLQSQDYEKVTDTLDVWFDSGVSHFCVLKKAIPADLYLEGSDQYRGWFQSSLLTSIAINDFAPYKSVMMHGFVVDGSGHKMSKSLGNVVDPKKVTDTLGADILRLWVASTYFHDDVAISDEILQRVTDAYRMIRNTARFLLGNLAGFDPKKDLIEMQKLLPLDQWAIYVTVKNLNTDWHTACSNLQSLLSAEMSSFYFSIIKDRLYTLPEKSFERRSAQTALHYILNVLVRSLAPILSFTAEEIWQEMHETKTVFAVRWDNWLKLDVAVVETVEKFGWQEIIDVRNAVNKELERLRIAGVIGSSLEAEVVLHCDKEKYALLGKLGDELRFILITSAASIVPSEISELQIEVKKTAHKKCCRCWHYREEVGKNAEHPELCGRCVDNLK